MDNKTLTISDAGSLLMGAGLVKLDDIVIGLSLIAVGAILKIVVAYLQSRGIDIRGDNPVG